MVKVGKSILKIAQILRSPATISSFATCLQSVSLCFHPIHSHPVKEKKSSYKSHPIFILGEITIFRVNPGHVCYFQIIVHGGSTGIFHQRSGPDQQPSEAQRLGSLPLLHDAPWATAHHFHQRPRNPCLSGISRRVNMVNGGPTSGNITMVI